MSARNPTDSADALSSDAGARVEERREQILEAAARVISERGADGTRLADIARKAGVSIGLIQHYFNTRDELLAEAFDYFNEIWVTEWEQQADAESDPPHKLVTSSSPRRIRIRGMARSPMANLGRVLALRRSRPEVPKPIRTDLYAFGARFSKRFVKASRTGSSRPHQPRMPRTA